MDKIWPTLLIAAAVAALFYGMWLGWRHRARRDSRLSAPSALEAPGETLLAAEALHVATTHHDKPLDRVVMPGLAYRSNATLTVTRGGVTIAAAGEPSVAIAANRISGAGAATWTIDRSVERDGLLVLEWRVAADHGDDAELDTYLRVSDAELQARLIDGIRSIITRTPTGNEV
jgi:hypothetical protein